ncbi:hypothetical protein V8E51_004556, partial [Hyaloscypha variabilis]
MRCRCGVDGCYTARTCTKAASQLVWDAVAFACPREGHHPPSLTILTILTILAAPFAAPPRSPSVRSTALPAWELLSSCVWLGSAWGPLMMRASPVPSLADCTLSIALSGEADTRDGRWQWPRRPAGQESVPQQRARCACQPAALAHWHPLHSRTGQRGAVLPDHGQVSVVGLCTQQFPLSRQRSGAVNTAWGTIPNSDVGALHSSRSSNVPL